MQTGFEHRSPHPSQHKCLWRSSWAVISGLASSEWIYSHNFFPFKGQKQNDCCGFFFLIVYISHLFYSFLFSCYFSLVLLSNILSDIGIFQPYTQTRAHTQYIYIYIYIYCVCVCVCAWGRNIYIYIYVCVCVCVCVFNLSFYTACWYCHWLIGCAQNR